MTARLGWLGVLLVFAILIAAALTAFLFLAWPVIRDFALVTAFLAAIFVGAS